MKAKRLRIASIVILLGLIAAIPASTQVFRSGGDDGEGTDLRMLVLVNRMELTVEQMEEIHGVLGGLLEERETHELRFAEFEQDMIAFDGTAEDLDEILEAFRAETAEQVEAARERATAAIDQVKEILTAKQGEILDGIFPGFLGGREAPAGSGRTDAAVGGLHGRLGARERDAASGMREAILGRLEERFADRPEALQQLQQRLGGAAGGFRVRGGGMGRGMRGQAGCGIQENAGGFAPMRGAAHDRGQAQRGADWIEQLLEVLELKLEAIG